MMLEQSIASAPTSSFVRTPMAEALGVVLPTLRQWLKRVA